MAAIRIQIHLQFLKIVLKNDDFLYVNSLPDMFYLLVSF